MTRHSVFPHPSVSLTSVPALQVRLQQSLCQRQEEMSSLFQPFGLGLPLLQPNILLGSGPENEVIPQRPAQHRGFPGSVSGCGSHTVPQLPLHPATHDEITSDLYSMRYSKGIKYSGGNQLLSPCLLNWACAFFLGKPEVLNNGFTADLIPEASGIADRNIHP